MTRHHRNCPHCGVLRWLDLPLVGVQRVGEDTQALELRNAPACGSTLAEVAGHALAARHVRVGAVRITEVSQ